MHGASTAEGHIRVTNREREAAAEELRAAYAEGCLDDGELEDRISLAYTAKTRDDLAALVSDLPAVPAPARAPEGPGPGDWFGRARRSLGLACWLMLAAAGAWLIAVVAGGLVAVPLIFLWLVSLQLRSRVPGLGRSHAAAPLTSHLPSVPVSRRGGKGQRR
jgi:hypothetical protein